MKRMETNDLILIKGYFFASAYTVEFVISTQECDLLNKVTLGGDSYTSAIAICREV